MSTDRPTPAPLAGAAPGAPPPGASGAPGEPRVAEPFWRSWAVGERVIVRYRLDEARSAGAARTPGSSRYPTGAGPSLTDALGELLAVDEHGVTVRTRRGDVAVPAAAITLGKRVPPPPARRRPARPAPPGTEA